jgi:hypothetical protein
MLVPSRSRALLLLLALTGCSSSSSGTNPAADASLSDSPSGDTGAKDTGSDTGVDLDGGVDGDAAPGVGVIACGTAECKIPSEVCCPAADGGAGGACYPKGAAPCTPLECDQPGDCAAGTTCCYQFQSSCGTVGSKCVAACAPADVGACLGLGDCLTCVSQTCAGVALTTCGTDGVCCK